MKNDDSYETYSQPTLIKNKYLINDKYSTLSIQLLKVILGVLLVFAGNQLSINIKPVPITLLTVMVSLIGLTYSPKLGLITMITYILAGAIGLPMFANFKSGIAYLFGPSGGYLIGNMLAAPLMAGLKDKLSNKLKHIILICLAGHTVIFLCGVGWLSTFIGVKSAIFSGFIIFIPSGICKIIIFSLLFSYISKGIKK